MTKIDVYRCTHGNLIEKPNNFSWVIDYNLAGCALPTTIYECKWLVNNMGLKTIVTVREEPLPKDWIDECNVDYLLLRVADFGSPSVDELAKTIDYIDIKINQEKKPVIIHCLAGKGRTGTVLACYFIKQMNMDARKAMTRIRNIRPGSIQSPTQEDTIFRYEQFLKR